MRFLSSSSRNANSFYPSSLYSLFPSLFIVFCFSFLSFSHFSSCVGLCLSLRIFLFFLLFPGCFLPFSFPLASSFFSHFIFRFLLVYSFLFPPYPIGFFRSLYSRAFPSPLRPPLRLHFSCLCRLHLFLRLRAYGIVLPHQEFGTARIL